MGAHDLCWGCVAEFRRLGCLTKNRKWYAHLLCVCEKKEAHPSPSRTYELSASILAWVGNGTAVCEVNHSLAEC